MNSCVFLDRDGVINKDNPNYTFRVKDFEILPGVIGALEQLKLNQYLLIVVTNQSGISQSLYTRQQMEDCHRYFQQQCGNLIDHFYFSPYHPSVTESLIRKPGTLMFEKAIAKFDIDARKSWMIGDNVRDIIPARKLGIQTIQVGNEFKDTDKADFETLDLPGATEIILSYT
jgi:D-glycero-D-manno-heptose 1,7-bisphosphate phosphatase